MISLTRVINSVAAPNGWEHDPRFAYIGRAGRGLSGAYGNAHPIGYCEICKILHDHYAAIEAFAIEARTKFASDPVYREHVEKIRGRYLVCFCKKPKVEVPCHGDIYVELLHGKEAPAPVDESDCLCTQESRQSVWQRVLNPRCPVHGTRPNLKVVS